MNQRYYKKIPIIECSKGILGWVLIDSLSPYPPLISSINPWLTLDRHSIDNSVGTQSTLHQHCVRKSTKFLIDSHNSVDTVLIQYWSACWSSIDQDVDWRYWWTLTDAFSTHDPEILALPDCATTAMSFAEGGGCLHMVSTLFMSSNPLPIIPLGVCAKSKQCPSSCIEAPRPVA